jgi:hypothetical protein
VDFVFIDEPGHAITRKIDVAKVEEYIMEYGV